MSDTVYTDYNVNIPIISAWLNDINNVVYRLLGNSSGVGGAAPTTTAQILANLGGVGANNTALTGTTTLVNQTTSGTAIFNGTAQFNGAVDIGASLGYSDTGILSQMVGNTNGYNQLIVQNNNAGAAASADVIVGNNQATATTHYGDFGINSSAFTGTGSLNQAGYVYMYSASTDLAIGTLGASNIHFVVNNGATDALEISSAGNVTMPAGGTFSASGGITATPVSATTISASSTITPSQTSGIVGTTAINNAQAGSVGEVITASASAVGLTTVTTANITSISLTAGDWDVWGTVEFDAATSGPSQVQCGITATSATMPAAPGRAIISAALSIAPTSLNAPTSRVNISATTTYYMVAQASFTNTCTATGIIIARRRR